MRINRNTIKNDEKATFQLRTLYQSYGYSQYKMGKFEEYELYAKNKDFIESDSILTFTDANGKLMALKPDLTLSIVKNYHGEKGYVEKVYYNENIYRGSKNTHSFKEIMQTGLECIGDIDLYNICEVTMLAAKSLHGISNDFVLEISHLGIVSAILEPLALDEKTKDKVVKCIGNKNIHEMRELLQQFNIEEEIYKSLETMVLTYGNYKKVIKVLRGFNFNSEAVKALDELETVCDFLTDNKMGKNINIDFSIVNDMTYYSGILFKGFVNGIPSSVLSGGQYDKLLVKMGKKAGAIGFAVYLDSLDHLDISEKQYDIDVVLLYEKNTNPEIIAGEMKKIVDGGETVMAQRVIPTKIKYRKLMKIGKKEVEVIENNDQYCLA